MSKLNEFVDTGTLKLLERERNNPLNELTKIYGVGPKRAKEFVSKGITTIEELKQHPELLTTNMKLGIKYFDDIEARIPREEIDKYKEILTPIFNKSTPPGSTFEIVGSYRRGAKTSGDIDIIITNDENNKKAFIDFLNKLIEDEIVIEVLSRGASKSLTIAQIPGHRPRRLDLLYSHPDEYGFAILYFTGSKIFNTVQRQRALNLRYSLNEHGLYHMINGKKGNKVDGTFPTEKSIFDFLGMEYREPKDRINSKSVKLITKSPTKTILNPPSPKKN
jgi:DNA polymerase/3'-5' exonuclease PolX